jgi:hypothetical protein
MRGRGTNKKYNQGGDAWAFLGRQDQVCTVAHKAVVYRFASADFPISCRESDWVLKLGPPLG